MSYDRTYKQRLLIYTYKYQPLSQVHNVMYAQQSNCTCLDDEDVIARQKHQVCDPFHVQAVIDEYR